VSTVAATTSAALALANSGSAPNLAITGTSEAQTVTAVVSSPAGTQRVDFSVNGVTVASFTQAPFAANLALSSAGPTTITATVYSSSGLSAIYSTRVLASGSSASSSAL
jgi:hypothetical protein